MIAYARHQFWLAAPTKDGSTIRDHLLAGSKQTGEELSALAGPPLPEEATYLWQMFLDIADERPPSGGGMPALVPSTAIEAWCRMNGVSLFPWEFRAIRRLDRAWREMTSRAHHDDAPPELDHA